MSDGVIHWFCGMRVAERLAVAMHSCRKHWAGDMLLYLTEDCAEIGQRIAAAVGAQVEFKQMRPVKKHAPMVTKAWIPEWSPFDRTVYIDADTVVARPFLEMFEHPVAITTFSNWTTRDARGPTGIIGGRILHYNHVPDCPPRIRALVEAQIATPHPALNTGVFGFHAGGTWWREWQEVSEIGALNVSFTDEIAMQILWPGIDGLVLMDDRYNASPKYGQHNDDARIWHFHGRKHLRDRRGRVLWEPAFRAAYDENVGGLAEWAGLWDPWVHALLHGGTVDDSQIDTSE